MQRLRSSVTYFDQSLSFCHDLMSVSKDNLPPKYSFGALERPPQNSNPILPNFAHKAALPHVWKSRRTTGY